MKRTFLFKKLLAAVVAMAVLIALAIPVSAAAYDTSNATRFTFSDGGISVEEGAYTGYKIKNTALTISDAGTYIVTGSCANGAIVIKKNVADVTLILDGLTLTASATAPLTCNKGSGVTIVAAEGSVNNLADDQYNNDDIYTDETLYPDIENAVIKCKDGSNVTICGTGTINVTANGKNGIKGGADLYEEDADGNATDTLLSAASLTIKDVTLNVTIKHNYKDPEDPSSYDGDGIKSEKELNILSGNITVSANDDGIKCDYTMNIGAEGAEGPTVTIAKSTEGIEAATINVYSGNITVSATDDGINAANSDLTNYSFSYNQYGGHVYVNCSGGDGVDSNGSVNFAGGTTEIYSPAQGDGDPIDSETGATFSGGTVLAVGNNAMGNGYNGVYVAFGGSGGFGGAFGGGSNLVTAGSTITVKDASGNTLYTGKAVRNAGYVVFASPALISGSSCTLYNGSSNVSTASAVTGSNAGGIGPGGMGPGGQGGMGPGGQTGGQSGAGFSGFIQTVLQWFRNLIDMLRNLFSR